MSGYSIAFYQISIIVIILFSFFLLSRLKIAEFTTYLSKIIKILPIVILISLLFFTFQNVKTLPLLILQTSVIVITFFIGWIIYRLFVNKIKNEFENISLKNKLSKLEKDSQIINNANLNEALKEKLEKSLFPISGVNEHRKWLEKSFMSANKRICVLSGWATSYVVDEQFKVLVQDALKRGVYIYLGFGYQSSSDKKVTKSYENKAALKLWKLREWSSELQVEGRLDVFEFPNHAKLLIKDSDYAVIGSFNWLSNARGKNLERSWVVTEKTLIDKEFEDVISNMEDLRKIDKRNFLTRFLPFSDY